MKEVKRVVMDASALIKWFIVEEESKECRILRDLHIKSEIEIYTCDLALIEIANALRYIPGLTVNDVVNSIEALRLLEIKFIDSNKIINNSIRIAYEFNLTVYDALYMALAEEINAPLITYDKELLAKFKNKSMKASAYLKQFNFVNKTL